MYHFAPPVSSLEEIAQRLTQKAERLRTFGVEAATVFGSFATGAFDGGSDVDLIVEPGPSTLRGLIDLQDVLESALMRRVDVLTRAAAKPSLLAEASRVGRKILL
ncbi:MAG: nucleotidyltransferase domain-containing protein [Oceanicaulis sp.]